MMSGRRGCRVFVRSIGAVLGALLVLGLSVESLAQPPLGQMSGIPLPDPELPDGTITVRVIRGQVTNNVVNQEVELHQGDNVTMALTDANGRATFSMLSPGAQVQAFTELDGQSLKSQPFTAPGRGGIRVMLVGFDSDAPKLSVRSGIVTFGSDSWIQVELVEESVEVYFFLELVNLNDSPVEPAVPIVFDLPSGAQGTSVLRSSTPQAVANGPRIEVQGPFDSGTTPVHFAYILPYTDESLTISQTLPADLDSLLVSVEKWGMMDFVSSQVQRRMEVPPEGPNLSPYIVGRGPGIPAGQPWMIELMGLPHRDNLPSSVAVVVALGIFGFGIWGAIASPDTPIVAKQRRLLEARKEKLFTELVKVERQYRGEKIGSTKHMSRRQELVVRLERVYHDLDEQLTSVLLSSRPVASRSHVEHHSGTGS